MKYRISKEGEAYFPQYKCNDNTDWVYVDKSDIKGTMLEDVANALGNLSFPRRWESGAVYTKHGNNRAEVNKLYFKTELHTMAFLGAAKSFWSTKTEEVEI